jgi:hypothetical protein
MSNARTSEVGTLVRSLEYPPDTLIGSTCESSRNNRSAFITAVMLKREDAVAFSHPNQSDLPSLNVDGPPVNVDTFLAEFHGASGIAAPASWCQRSLTSVKKKPARSRPRLMHPQRRQRGPIQYRTPRRRQASAK